MTSDAQITYKRCRCGVGKSRQGMLRTTATVFMVLLAFYELFAAPASSFRIKNNYSKFNSTRPARPSTKYIILHTTEGAEKGSLSKIRRYGEANYFVCESGLVYRIIDKNRIATHTGRSMWDGQTTIDNYSIGIEVVGYYSKDITDAQYEALKELLRQLQSVYDIPDENVLTHSMVAYGRPNRYHPYNHRGRKKCGMIFAQPEVRFRLGLEGQPKSDPDVEAGRVKVGDKELFSFLFPKVPEPVLMASAEPILSASAEPAVPPRTEIEIPDESRVISNTNTAWYIARELYDHPSTVYTFPNGSTKRGDEIENWVRIPPGTRVTLNEMDDEQAFEGFLEIGKDGSTAKEIAGEALASATTIYFFPDGYIRTGAELQQTSSGRKLLQDPPSKTRILVGYIYGGQIQARRSASYIAGRKWNYPSTYYRLPNGSILSGDNIDSQNIPRNTLVFFQQ